MPPKNNSKEQLPDGNKKSPEKKKRSFEAIQDGKQIWQVGQEIFLPEGVDKENTTNDAFPKIGRAHV